MEPTSTREARIASLSKVQMFSTLAPKGLGLIAAIVNEVSAAEGEVLFRAGDVGDRLYLILSGRVRISRTVPGMGEEALAIFGPGDSFGELALIDSAPRSADAIIHEDATFLELSKGALEELLFLHKDLAYEVLWNMVRTLAARLRDTTDKVTFLAVTGKFG
ncbi:MAG: cyclic nucleotide-binding domain-containing protein [Myxococcales bacterium]|jgi:CRP-like cAMP-binding protein|nr:cyclic nucleotide-binding domain-containing protein [Myxococcales bacterium]